MVRLPFPLSRFVFACASRHVDLTGYLVDREGRQVSVLLRFDIRHAPVTFRALLGEKLPQNAALFVGQADEPLRFGLSGNDEGAFNEELKPARDWPQIEAGLVVLGLGESD